MTKLTKEQALVVSGFTGILCCKFDDFHEEIERRIKRPIFTHEMASDKVWENEIKPAFEDDFLAMLPEDYLMKNHIKFYWCRVYGLGLAVERSYVLDNDDCTCRVFHGKVFLGPLTIDFSLWLA